MSTLNNEYERAFDFAVRNMIGKPIRVGTDSKQYSELIFKISSMRKTDKFFTVETEHQNNSARATIFMCVLMPKSNGVNFYVEGLSHINREHLTAKWCGYYNDLLSNEFNVGDLGKYEVDQNGAMVFRSNFIVEGNNLDVLLTRITKAFFLVFSCGALPSYIHRTQY